VRHLTTGAPVCLPVISAHALVYSKSARYHSGNHASIVCFGSARPVTYPSAKMELLVRLIGRYDSGRAAGGLPGVIARGPAGFDDRRGARRSAAGQGARGGPLGPLDAGPAALGAVEFATLSAALLTKRGGRTEER
jgi:hypothetical protein